MSDNVDPTWWAAAGAFGTALVGGIAKIMGSPKERAEAKREEADAAARLVDVATDVAEEAREDTRRVRVERDDCQTRLAAMDVRVRALEAGLAELASVHAACPTPAEFSRLRREVDRLSMQSTPPMGIRPDEVHAAMAAEETGP